MKIKNLLTCVAVPTHEAGREISGVNPIRWFAISKLDRALAVTLFGSLLGFAVPAQSACMSSYTQIAPSPNPAGNTITVGTSSTATYLCNEVNEYQNNGTVKIVNGWFANYSVLNNNGKIDSLSGGFSTEAGSTLNNYGTIGGTTVANRGTWNNYGESAIRYNNIGATINNFDKLYGSIQNAGVINNTGSFQGSVIAGGFGIGGVTNNSVGGTITSSYIANRDDSVINNNGTMYITGWATNSATINNKTGAVLNVSGTVDTTGSVVNNGQVSNSGQFWNSGTVSGAGVITQTAGAMTIDGAMTQAAININGGTLQGMGNISAPVTFGDGVLAPGNSLERLNSALVGPGNALGSLAIVGDLTFNGGKLAIEIAGVGLGEFDLLSIYGKSTFLGGILEFSFQNGFLPQIGDHWNFFVGDGPVTGWESLGISVMGFDTSSFSLTAVDSGLMLSVTSPLNPINIATSVPEPDTYAMLFAGLVLLGVAAQRRKRKGCT